MAKKISVLFVCLGNICRSPTAHGVLQQKLEQQGLSQQVLVDSAGTAAYHIGKQPDQRSQQFALKRGYDFSNQRARQAVADDFYRFDYVLAMDHENLMDLQALAPSDGLVSPQLFLQQYSTFSELEVPDPYYGGDQGFEHVLDLIEDAVDQLIVTLKKQLAKQGQIT